MQTPMRHYVKPAYYVDRIEATFFLRIHAYAKKAYVYAQRFKAAFPFQELKR